MQHTLSLCVPSQVRDWQALAFEACPRDEHERADRFAFEPLRRRFLCGRAMLRHLLAGRLNRNPCNVRLDKTPKGQLIAPESGLWVSLSYSEDLVGVLLGEGPLGLDLEFLDRTNDLRGVAGHAFRPEERATMAGLEGDAERTYFFRVWCEKEAVSKAMGTGMSIGFNTFDARASAAELGLNVHTFPLQPSRSSEPRGLPPTDVGYRQEELEQRSPTDVVQQDRQRPDVSDRREVRYLACLVLPRDQRQVELVDWNREFTPREVLPIPQG